jgi:hypothetical protein
MVPFPAMKTGGGDLPSHENHIQLPHGSVSAAAGVAKESATKNPRQTSLGRGSIAPPWSLSVQPQKIRELPSD